MKRAARSASPNSRIYAAVACGIAIVLLVGSIIPLPSLPSLAPVQAPAPLRSIPNTDVNPYGANFFLDWEVEPWKVEKTLELAKDAGIGWANLHFPWEGLEPKKGIFWDDRMNKSTWDKYDNIVRVAVKYGLKPIVRLDRPPSWTRKDNAHLERPPDNFADYGDFVEAVASHYKGRVGYYQIWNEPNIFPEWGDRPADPAGYVKLLAMAYERIKRADPNALVLTAPLAQTTEMTARNITDLEFLTQMYRAGAKSYFDILYANGYGFDAPPEEPADATKLNFSRVQLLRRIMEQNGDGGKAVWFHEFGWNAAPPTLAAEKLIWRRVSEQQQADYTTRAIRYARQQWPWAGVFSIWYFRQDGHISPDVAEYYFRMVDPGFTPRLVYNAVAADAKAVAVAGPGSYHESNPALTVDSGWRESRNQSGSLLVADSAGASITIRFVGTEFQLMVAKGPDESRLLVTVDGRAGNLLAASGEGRSVLDLHSSSPASVVVPVANNLPYGQHTVRVVVAAGLEGDRSRAALYGFQVGVSDQNTWTTYLTIGFAALLVVVVLVLLWRHRGSQGSQG